MKSPRNEKRKNKQMPKQLTFSESSNVAHPSIVLGNTVFPLDFSTFV